MSRIAAQVEAQHQPLRLGAGGAGGLVVALGVADQAVGATVGAAQAVGRPAAAGVLAPQGGGADFGVEGAGAGDAARVGGLAPGLGGQEIDPDQFDPAQILALTSLGEEFAKITTELEHRVERLKIPDRDERRPLPSVSCKRSAATNVQPRPKPTFRPQFRFGVLRRHRCRAARAAGASALSWRTASIRARV